MYLDTEKLSEDLYNRSLSAVEVDPVEYAPMIATAEIGWTPFDEPQNYRWFLIRDFPVKLLQVTLRKLMAGARDPGQEKFQHDRIIELWKKGAPKWPVFVTATGIIADGYHRTAAHKTKGLKTVDVIVSVQKRTKENHPQHQDEAWHEAFPVGR